MANTGGEQLRDVLSKRYLVLESLSVAPKTKPALVDELEYSRSTINRAIDELLDVDCVEPTETAGRRFRLTSSGRLAFQLHRDYRAETERVRTSATLLNTIPADDAPSKAFLADADVHSSARTPDVALRPGADLLDGASRMVGTAPVVQGEYFDVLTGRLRDGLELELVVETTLLEALERTYEDEFATLSEFDGVDVYVTEETLPYALWLIERRQSDFAGITVYEDGGLKGTVVNDTEAAVSWARDRYARYRAAATNANP